jgi:hypothetical protein
MCDTCRQAEAAAESQATWLRQFGINPYAYYEFRVGYLERLDYKRNHCPESLRRKGSGTGEDSTVSGSAGDEGDSPCRGATDERSNPEEVSRHDVPSQGCSSE